MSPETHPQDALAGLRKWKLTRDDESDPDGRVYRDKAGTIYHSVTRILSATAPPHQQAALQRWLSRPSSEDERLLASQRGTLAHNHAEYLLKTARKIATHAANKRGAWVLRCASCGRSASHKKFGLNGECPFCAPEGRSDGLICPPRSLTTYGLQKAIEGAPRPAWSASGFARGLRHWIEANVTAIHSVEFSIHHPAGFAGTADGLLDIQGTLCICDWKTTKKSIHSEMDAVLEGYKAQAGAYSLGLTHLTGIVAPSAAIVVARRTGAPSVTLLGEAELRLAEDNFLERVGRYFLALNPPY